MALRNIVLEGDSCLRKTARRVTLFNSRLHELLDDMRDTLDDANGAGLAAPQVGVLRRAVIIANEDGGYTELVNPEIIEVSEEQLEDMEGCLSVPGIYGIVPRPQRLKVRAQDRNGKVFELECENFIAREVCHETEHLDGHLFREKVIRYLSDEEIQEIRQQYLEDLMDTIAEEEIKEEA